MPAVLQNNAVKGMLTVAGRGMEEEVVRTGDKEMKVCGKGHQRGTDIPENENQGPESVVATEKLKNRSR